MHLSTEEKNKSILFLESFWIGQYSTNSARHGVTLPQRSVSYQAPYSLTHIINDFVKINRSKVK